MRSVSVFTPWYPSPAEPWQGTFIHNQVTALRSLGVDTRVVKLFTGRLSPLDIAARLAGSDLIVLPSRRDAFGCVYLEAMVVGVPTIVSRNAGMAHLIEDDRYVHDPDDVTEIIGKAAAILSDVQAYENALEHGRKLSQRYTWDEHAGRLRDVLEKVVRQRRGDTSYDRSGGADAKP